MKNDTFTLWGVQDNETGRIVETRDSRQDARKLIWHEPLGFNGKVVKLECRIVEQRPKKPRKPKTFTAHGLEWIPHNPGDPMPCDGEKMIRILWRKEKEGDSYQQARNPAKEYDWEVSETRAHRVFEIVGWNFSP
jgi:hypothetical protein